MPNIGKIRRLQTAISVLLFFLVFIICWATTQFKITEIQVSYWGVSDVWLVWSIGISIISVLLFFNSYFYITDNVRIKQRRVPLILFGFSCFSLLVVGLFNITHQIHDPAAYFYFFTYPLAIFVLSYLNRADLPYRSWLIHLSFSMAMTILPFSLIGMFKGLAISEIIHSLIVVAWNVWLLKDHK